MTSYNILTDLLSDSESAWLAQRYPKMADSDGYLLGPYDYCPTCKKTGSYRYRGEDHECDCIMQLQLHKHYSLSGIIEPYQRLGWDDFTGSPELAEVVKIYLDHLEGFIDNGMALLLYGPHGTGKTLACTLILKELIKRGHRCYATTFSETVEAFTAGWKSDDDKRWFDHKFRRTPILLLDDLGKEYKTKTVQLPQTTFDNLLRTRVQHGLPTFLTTNMTPDELGVGYGASALSLLQEQSLIHEVLGVDHRRGVGVRKVEAVLAHETRPVV